MSEHRINVRTTEEIKRDVEIAARLRGMTVSSLVNSLLVKAIREEKHYDPSAFREAAELALLSNYPSEADIDDTAIIEPARIATAKDLGESSIDAAERAATKPKRRKKAG